MEKEKGRERERKKERVKKGNVVGYTRLAWKTLPTLRPAGLKERKRGKKRKKERKKGAPAGGATFADLRLHRHLLQESFSRSDIDLCGSLWLATIHFLLICDRESFHVIRHRFVLFYRREQREYQTSWCCLSYAGQNGGSLARDPSLRDWFGCFG